MSEKRRTELRRFMKEMIDKNECSAGSIEIKRLLLRISNKLEESM